MSVVTIYRGTFSGGKRLAGHLGHRCVDRDVTVEKAAAWGVSQQELRVAMETPPTFLELLSHNRYLYLALVQAALTEDMQGGGRKVCP